MFTNLDQPRWLQRCASECRRVATYLILLCLTTFFAAAQTTLALSSGSGNAATTVNLNLAYFSGTAAAAVSAVQWTFTYSAADVASITVNPGTEATAAQKNILCSAGTGTYTCLAVGLANQNTIQDGTLAVVQIGLAANPSSSVPVQLSNEIASDPNGNSVPIGGTAGSISVTSPELPGSTPGSGSNSGFTSGSTPGSTTPALPIPALTGISCVPSFLIEPGTSTCTVGLSGPAPPNLQLVASSSSPALSVSPLIAVSAGATTTLLSVTGNPANADRSGTVTITLGSSTASIPFNLLPPLATTGFQVVNQNTGTCLTALTFTWLGSPLGAASQQACSGAPNQIVSLSAVGSGYTLGFKQGGLFLNAAASSFGWASILFSPLSSGTNQTWQLVPAAAGTFLLFSLENQECLEVAGNSKAEFARVQQSACSVNANQSWSLIPVDGKLH